VVFVTVLFCCKQQNVTLQDATTVFCGGVAVNNASPDAMLPCFRRFISPLARTLALLHATTLLAIALYKLQFFLRKCCSILSKKMLFF